VEKHQGDIKAESAEGEGALFTVTFPDKQEKFSAEPLLA
jgi:signal transduction histidine kinase